MSSKSVTIPIDKPIDRRRFVLQYFLFSYIVVRDWYAKNLVRLLPILNQYANI